MEVNDDEIVLHEPTALIVKQLHLLVKVSYYNTKKNSNHIYELSLMLIQNRRLDL